MTMTSTKVIKEEEVEDVKLKIENDVELIKENLFEKLGNPPNLYRADILPVGGSFYRINVWCKTMEDKGLLGGCIAVTRIAHSYYTRVDDNSIIVFSNPEIKKTYNEQDSQG